MSTFSKYRLKGAYHFDWYESEDWYKECVDECVKFCKGKTIDIGCGDGLLVSKLQDGFGIDTDPDGIRLAKEKGLPVTQKSVYELKGTWEYMACLNVIEHLDHPSVLKHVIDNNVTKGAIIITNQYLGGALGEDHRREYDYKELLDFFKEYKPKGFKTKDGLYIGVKITK